MGDDVIMTVLIVDDHEGFRADVREMLETVDYQVIGKPNPGSTGPRNSACWRDCTAGG
jgi:DNA-binding NarL/FixJ family response regulator